MRWNDSSLHWDISVPRIWPFENTFCLNSHPQLLSHFGEYYHQRATMPFDAAYTVIAVTAIPPNTRISS
jgi:hypothetical protein